MRQANRAPDALRFIEIIPHAAKYAEGSCLIKFGDTHVLCAASVADKVPFFMRGQGQGWVTAEYGMLPRATNQRTDREAVRGAQTGRTQEIQRLIGRALRACIDQRAMGEMQIKLDCDVLQADGGTRTAAITGGYVALALAFKHLVRTRRLHTIPLVDSVAAVSCGLYKGACLLDLDYNEDSNAQADANFVLTGAGGIVEVQATAERSAFAQEEFLALLDLARKGIAQLSALQKDVIEKE
ncbi:MAG: ribonuclease PH [Alphaproteobacteria bacterium]|nr:ribonuclease PH [Alphaproteobacteria bacterium]